MSDWNFSELAQALWKTCADNGIGSLLRPGQRRRDAYAEADAKRIDAQGEFDAQLILKGEKTLADFQLARSHRIARIEGRFEPDFDMEALPALVAEQHVNDLVRREVNIAKALLHAEEELQKDESPAPTEGVDGDWLRRWRDSAGEVSSEDLQQLWGRLIAGEVKSPRTYSLRVFDIIRNMSSGDAGLVAKLAPLVIQGFVWRESGQEYLSKIGIDFDDVLYLEEIGVVASSAGMLRRSWSNGDGIDSYHTLMYVQNLGLIIESPVKSAVAYLTGFALTRAGMELIKLCKFEADREYLIAVANHLKTQGFTLKLVQLEDVDNEYVQVLTEVQL
ncbi:hypothetical protein ABIC11_000082 [Pseudomonas oryzihabitans]